ncbi:MAG TPA: hypothetical protein VM222_05135, partial [Planctomycetota bacterium]|nr:hypothetical protein [Planctomycetota bacterium]
KEQDFTGIGISCGGGMFNVCVAYKSVPALTFATSRGGDWIDNNVAHAIGMSPALVCGIKESGVDLMNPKDRVQDAIVIYYRNLIQYTLETIRHKLESAQNMPTFVKPIDVVCGGGTSMITGFIDVFRDEFEKINFPIDIATIRMANDPLKAVARGCMVAAIEETRALTDVDVQVAPATLERTVASVSKMDDGTKRRLGPMAMPQRASIGDRSAPVRVAAPVAPPSRPAAIAPAVKVVKVAPPVAPPPSPTRETAVRVSPFTAKPPPPPPKKKEAELELVEVEEIQDLTPEPKKQGDEADDIPLIS